MSRYSRTDPRYRVEKDRDRVTVCGLFAVSLAMSVASLAISVATLVAVQ